MSSNSVGNFLLLFAWIRWSAVIFASVRVSIWLGLVVHSISFKLRFKNI